MKEFGIFQKRINNSFAFSSSENSISFHNRIFSSTYCQKLNKGDLLLLTHSEISDKKKSQLTAKGVNIANLLENTIHINSNNKDIHNFISFARRYGIRLSLVEKEE